MRASASSVVVVAALLVPSLAAGQTITTVAGVKGVAGFAGDGGPATSALLSDQVYGVTTDAAGNVYIADTHNNRIRKVATNGIITTIAGTGVKGFSGDGGSAVSATMDAPLSVAVDSVGRVFFSDQNNNRIRRIDLNGTIATVAGSGLGNFDGDAPKAATSAKISHPFGICFDAADTLYITDTGNQRIRKVVNGIISTVAGSGGPSGGTGGGVGGFAGDGGPATSALLQYPSFVAVDKSGNVFIADELNERVRWVRKSDGKIFTLAGTGVAAYNGDNQPAANAQLNRPYGVGVDPNGDVYIADYLNFRIRKVTMSTGMITTFAGIGSSGMSDDGLPAASAHLADPVGLYIDAAGVMFEVDQSSFRIRKITPPAGATPPATPSGFTAVVSGPNSAQLSWNPVSGATSYIAKVSLSSGAQKAIVTTTTSTLIGVPGLTQGQPYYFVVSATNSGGQSADSPEQLVLIPRATARPTDMDGDGSSDLVVWRPSNGTWYWLSSSSSFNTSQAGQVPFGGPGDVPLTGDADGDGRADLIIWRPSTGAWYWLKSSSGSVGQTVFGGQGDVPLVGDIDGDAKVDLIVWRPSTGMWYWLSSSSGYSGGGSKQFGSQSVGDMPMLADVDGDGRRDIMVWRASTGTFYWLTSSSSYTGGGSRQWGIQSAGDVPLVGDIDGDGKGDLVVWRGPTGKWYCLTSSSGYNPSNAVERTWGSQSTADVPSLVDRDGDGIADIAVWRATTGTWYWLKSSTGFTAGLSKQWGITSDVPIVK